MKEFFELPYIHTLKLKNTASRKQTYVFLGPIFRKLFTYMYWM